MKEFTTAMQELYDYHWENKGQTWRLMPLPDLLEKFDEEIMEVKAELVSKPQSGSWFKASPKPDMDKPKACKELLDLSLYCMMLYHRIKDESMHG